MSVKTLESYQEFIAVGSAYFTFNFNYADSSEIVVGMRTGDNAYEIVDPAHYVLTQNASTDGGKIRFVATKCENPDDPNCGDYVDNPPVAGTVVRIERKTVRSSTADWYVGLDMKSLVSLFDKLFRITQENADKFNNTIQTFPTQQGIKVRELLESHDKKIFYWNNEKQWLDITDFTIDDVIKQTEVGDILAQANAYSDEKNAQLETKINGKLSAVDMQIDANADAILKTREDFASADQAIRDDMNAEDSRLQTQITAQATAITTNKNDIDELGDDVADIQAKIPESASGSNPLVTKQQLLDEEMDIRDDLNEGLSELQTQVTAQAAEIATKQDKLTAGDNIVISGNVISATGAGGGAGFDVIVVQELPATGQKGIIYLLAKDGTAPDVYDEYVWITVTQTFELIGSTKVDLSNYLPLSGGTLTGSINFDLPYGSTVLKFGSSGTAEIKTNSQGYLRLPAFTTVYSRLDVDGNIGGPWNTVTTAYIRKLSCGGNNDAKLIVPDTAGTLARLEDLEGLGSLPDQTDNAGKFLTTNGTTASWSDKPIVNNSTNLYAVAVGRDAKATSTGATAFGAYTNSTGNYNIAFGFSAQATASAGYAIQLGKGTNADANTFKVGNANGNFTMMSADGTIPADRIGNLDFGTMD